MRLSGIVYNMNNVRNGSASDIRTAVERMAGISIAYPEADGPASATSGLFVVTQAAQSTNR